MDSSKRETQKQMEAIKHSILDGSLTHHQICDMLLHEIDKELKKNAEEVDMEYVNACQRLIESFYQEKAVQVESHADQNFAAVHAKLQEAKRPAHRKLAVKYVFSAACLLILLFGVDILFTNRRIHTNYSPDNEQIIFHGTLTTPGTIQRADANGNPDDMRELITTDWNETIAFLGYEPEMPTWLPAGWELLNYNSSIFSDFSCLFATYAKVGCDELLQYSVEYYFGSEPIHSDFEQDAIGHEVDIANGTRIKITSNIGSNVAFWHDGITIRSVTGTVSQEEILQMIESIYEQEE